MKNTGFIKALCLITALMCVLFSFEGLVFADSVDGAAENTVLAFPGAEGGGKYSPGARGIIGEGGKPSVYHVTSLGDSGRGTLRDAVSKPGRIVVFDVSGTIELTKDIGINRDNITILGQTAPGDGVTVSGGSVITNEGVQNIIIRYLKVRPTDKNGGEPDGIGGRYNTNVIFDHISASWCVDELLTLYAGAAQDAKPGEPVGNHLTIQNTIGSESLRMSNHEKGAHGYGGILGGTYATYVNNLMAHHDSRSPRLDRQLVATEVSNNIIYDWGQTNSAYGAEPYASGKSDDGTMMTNPSNVNYVGNYYKYGPSTRRNLRTRVFDVTGPYNNGANGEPKSKFYFADNYVESLGVIEDYKKSDIINNYGGAEFSENEIDMGDFAYAKKSSEEVYDYVLKTAGATLPRRDAVDARIVNDVKNGTGRVINNASEVGGLIPVESEKRTFEIPKQWLDSKGYTGKAETDILDSGYTVIEEYINEWTEEQSKTPPTNPNIIVQSPAIAATSDTIDGLPVDNGEWTVINEGETVNYKATAIAQGGNAVTKTELYDGNTKIAEYEGNEIDDNISLPVGTHYLTCRAINTRGEKTQSTTSIVYVKATAAPGSYSFAEIRESGYSGYLGKGGASMDSKGVYTIYGSGRLTTDSTDSCGFMYKQLTGDFDATVRVEEIPKFENQQVSGLMVRSGLEPGNTMAMIGDGWAKNGENAKILTRKADKTASQEIYFKDRSGASIDNSDDKHSRSMPKYMRIQRQGNTLTFSVSNTGTNWTDNDRQAVTVEYENLPDVMYVGLATDSANGVSTKEYFSTAKFSKLSLNGASDVAPPQDNGIPFYDTKFDNANWYFPEGSGPVNFSDRGNPAGGNIGEAALFWGEATRNFAPQNRGVLNITADFFTRSNESENVNSQAGARFMLNGIDGSGETVKIKSYYAQHDLGFYEDHDDLAEGGNLVSRPEDKTPVSDAKFELDKWYKAEMSLDYDTGTGTFSLRPYGEYNSVTETYITEAPIFEAAFDFDKSVSVNQLHFQRAGGYEMYLDNVGVSGPPVLGVSDGKIVVSKPETAAVLYIAAYDKNDVLTKCETRNIPAGENATFGISDFDIPEGCSAKAYLWGENNEPLSASVEVK